MAALLEPLAQDFVDGLYQARQPVMGGDYVVSRDDLSSYIAPGYMRAGVESLVTGRSLRREGLPRDFRGTADRYEVSLDGFLYAWADRGLTW